MAKAKRKKIDLPRLCGTMRRARQSLRKFRSERREAVRQFVGQHWSEEGSEKEVIVNLISMYVTIVGRSLIAKSPRFMLSTFSREDKPAVKSMQSWMNREVRRMGLQNQLTRVVIDALFSIGICKVALANPAAAAQVGWNLKAGQPFAQRVDLDDFVFDVHARDFEECSYVGHRYRVPLYSVKDSSLYSRQRKDLVASYDEAYNPEGDERIGVLGRSYYSQTEEEYEDHVDLWEIYLPAERRIVTLADQWLSGAEDRDNEPLMDQEWLGPDRGPYHFLGFGVVPGNAMPKAPIQDLIGLHDLANSLYRKLGEQARRQKEVTFVSGGADNDGNRLITTNDGEAVRIDSPDKLKQVVMGGPNQSNFLFFEKTWEYFSKHGGNLEMLGGLSPQSKTASQDKMLMGSASGIVTSMAQDATNLVESVGQALGWYWWNHPTQVMRTRFSLPGLPDYAVDQKVTPQQRKRVPFDELDLEVDPYSMQPQTPQSRMQAIQQVVASIQPFMQMAQQQGITLDLNAYLAKMAELLDIPELPDILTISQPPQQEGGEGAGGGGGPAETTRNYVRRSLGGEDGQQSDTAGQMQAAAGMDSKMPMNPSMNGA